MRKYLIVTACVLLVACGEGDSKTVDARDTLTESFIEKTDTARQPPRVSIEFSTFFNPTPSAGFTELWEPVFDSAGNIYVAGLGDYADPRAADNPYAGVPATVFDADSSLEGSSMMVAKLTPNGTPIWIAFLDGTGREKEIDGLAVDSEDNIVISGTTPNGDFPTTPGAFDTTINDGGKVNHNGDAFVAKISADGTRLIFSTFLGGSNGLSTSRGGIAVASDDSVYVVGQTFADNFLQNPSSGASVPVRAAYHGGIGDGFVLRLSADGSTVQWVTYIGASNDSEYGDVVISLAIGPKKKPHITALVRGDDATTTAGTSRQVYGGGVADSYAARLDPDGNLEWATYLGGSGEDGPTRGLRVDTSGNMVFTGYTHSKDWPVLNASQPQYGGSVDGYLVKLDSSGQLVFSTFIGGANADSANGVGLDRMNHIFIGGDTKSNDFPVTGNPLDSSFNGVKDVFGRIYDDSGALVYSTYIGGSDWDRCRFGTSTPDGDMILVGTTRSADFPVNRQAFNATYNGKFDSFITRLGISW